MDGRDKPGHDEANGNVGVSLAPRELLETLLHLGELGFQRGDLVVARRGRSSSAATTPTEYIQAQDEWVALLGGEATLEVAGEAVELHSGDYVFLPAGTPHSVRRVSDGAIWLAVHLHQAAT